MFQGLVLALDGNAPAWKDALDIITKTLQRRLNLETLITVSSV